MDTNGYSVTTNNHYYLNNITDRDTTITEFDFSKYAADYAQQMTFKEVKLARNGVEFSKSVHIDNKLKKVKQDKETKWQYTITTKVEGSEEKTVDTGYIANNDTIYVVYSNGRSLTSVETVNHKDLGFHLYMKDYRNPAGIGGGTYGENHGSITQGLYSRATGDDGYPTLTRNANKSIKDLFPATDKEEVNHLFIQSVYDETGYFYYNSAENFATLKDNNGNTTNKFTVYNQLGSPSNATDYYFRRGNFMPYNRLDTRNVWNYNLFDDEGTALDQSDPRYYEGIYGFKEGVNFLFGMYGVAEFYQPVGGQVNNEDMIFEFTGDDDMVVYIDGVLVLDLGGIHDAQSGFINFADGKVGFTDHATNTKVVWKETNIYDQYSAARKLKKTSWKEGTKTFADGTKHKIQFFYMERGLGASNLKIKVNIPPIPDGSVNIQKLVEGLNDTQAAKENYTLQLRMKAKDASDFKVAANQKYTLTSTGSKTYHTDENGKFTIHGTDTANFAGIAEGTRIEVTEPEYGRIYEVSYTAYDSNKKEIKGEVKVPSAGYVDVKVTNNAQDNPKSLTIVKKFEVNDQKADNAPDADGANKFKDATFTLYQKGENETEYEILYKDIKYSSFEGTAGSKSYTFEDLDPTKTYKVIENITSETDGGSSTTPYTGTDYAIGDITETTSWTTGTTSGAISLQTKKDGTYHYYDNKVTFVNKYHSPSVDVEFTKVDATDKNTGLAGAVFALYTDPAATTAYLENGTQVTATSGRDGKVTFKELPYDTKTGATYYMKEIQAPSGYVLDNSTIYTISITVNGKTVTTSILKKDTVINERRIENAAMQITFYKKAAEGETFLTGAVFELSKKAEDGKYQLFTDETTGVASDGQFTIPQAGKTLTHLPDGEYQIREITAPAGYNLLTGTVDFKVENGSVVDNRIATSVSDDMYTIVSEGGSNVVTIKNKAGIQLPETGGMGTLMTTMSGMALMLIALGYLILVKRREKGGLN